LHEFWLHALIGPFIPNGCRFPPGDCYVAVVGLPTPRSDHAVVASLFGRKIVCRMKILLKDLEKSLGPSTADLNIRVGLNR
jgi:hypothetical protein